MKKSFAMALAALALLTVSQQRASAWHKCNFGIGLNIACEGGGNSVLWGVLKGANVPGAYDGGHGGHGGGFFDPGMMAPTPFPGYQQPPTPEPMNPPAKKASGNAVPVAYQYQSWYPGYYPQYSYYPQSSYYPAYRYYWPYYGR